MTPTTMVHFRRAAPSDAAALIAIRSATHENPFSVQALAEAGITPASVAEGLERAALAGWVAETRDELIGFCLADLPKGELWVLAVLPGQEGRGVGREMLTRTEKLLWLAGHHSIWLALARPDPPCPPALRGRGLVRIGDARWPPVHAQDPKLKTTKIRVDAPGGPL